MKETVFAIDVDGVIRALVTKMLSRYNEDFGESLTLEDVSEYDVDKFFTRISKEKGISAADYFFDVHAKEMFSDSDVIEGAKEAIDTLRTFGKVVIVTYQKTLENIYMTLDWLDRHNIKYDSICFTKDKTIIQSDFMVDDNAKFLINANTNHAVIIDKAYNRGVSLEADRFKSLKSFADSYKEWQNHYSDLPWTEYLYYLE